MFEAILLEGGGMEEEINAIEEADMALFLSDIRLQQCLEPVRENRPLTPMDVTRFKSLVATLFGVEM